MPVQYAQVGAFLLVAVDGDFTVAELGRVLESAVQDGRVPDPARVLLDLSGAATLAHKTDGDLADCASLFASPPGRFDPVAVLLQRDAVDDLLRLGAAFLGRVGLRAAPFRSREEAESWLLDPE
ncbi:MAG: hypothetical protein JSU98_03695 [Gemmatimonadales bacterium]|jgi:hypothetical protein|nr:MAG: hypothetical protein JSU98_03695 [Gemmatimonadales bacterium]